MPAGRNHLTLVLDQGGHATRAIVFDATAGVRAQAERPVATLRLDDLRVEQDAEAIIASAEGALADVRAQLGRDFAQIDAAALATQRSSIVCWDRETGAPLSPVLSWQDRRAHAWLAQFAPHAAHVRQVTGLPLSPHYGVSKLRWCLDHLPAVSRAARAGRLCVGPLASFMLFRLLDTQPHVIDVANAARTLLLDITRLDWDAQLLSLFGIDRRLLPACKPTAHDFGRLRGTRIPLTVATGDQSAALFAQGMPRGDVAYVNVGTGAFVQRTTGARPVLHDSLLTGIVSWADRRPLYVLEGTVNGAGSALAWFARERNIDMPEHPLPGWLADPGDPPLFLNGIGGLGSPFWRPELTSRFIGAGDVAGQAVAIIESIVFLLHENLEQMRPAGPLRDIVIGGGLSRLDGMCQRLANLTALPVARLGLTEMTARGACFLVTGEPAQEAPVERFTPSTDPRLHDRYGRWRQALLAALAG